MLEAIVIHANKSFSQQLALLSLLLLVFTATPAHALETPPNLRWQHALTSVAHTNTWTQITDCKVLGNGNLAIVGQFIGTDPILGAPHQSAQQPTNGLFVAVQSPSGHLLWLHRFAGGQCPRLGIDNSDNIHLIGLTETDINLLGTSLAAEPDTILAYQLSFKADGTLNHLRPLGKIAGTEPYSPYFYLGLSTLCLPLADGFLVSLEFPRSIQIEGTTYESEEGASGLLWLKLDHQNEVVWAHCFSATANYFPPSFVISPAGGYLGFASLAPVGKFNGQPYGVSNDLTNSVLIWLAADGEVTKTARLHGEASPIFTGAHFASDGDLVLSIAGLYDGIIETSGSAPLEINFGPPPLYYGGNVVIARVAGDLSALRWQKGTKTIRAWSAGLTFDQNDNLYVALQCMTPLFFAGEAFKGDYPSYPPNRTALVKIAPDGQIQWVRFDESYFPAAFAVAPDGTSYLASSYIASYASSLNVSPPEFHLVPLTNHLAAAGSTLYFAPHVNGAAGTVYYWYKEGILITNSTSSPLVISNLSATHLGTYTVTASNQFGLVSTGPFTFTLGPSSPLAQVESMGQLGAIIEYSRPEARFSPDGTKYVIVGSTSFSFMHGTNYIPGDSSTFKTFHLAGNSSGGSNLFLAPPSISGLHPRAAIASDGTSFLVNRGTNNGAPCSWIVKYDTLGNQLWAHSFNSPSDYADVAVFKDQALYVAAGCNAGTIFGGTTLTEKGLYLLKFSLDGELLVAHCLLRPPNGLEAIILRLASDGSGYIFGSHLVHFDATGDYVWDKTVPWDGTMPVMACDTRGVVMGINVESGKSFFGSPPVVGTMAGGLVRWNRDGTLAWRRLIDSAASYRSCTSLALDPAGNVIAGLFSDGAIELDHIQLPLNPGSASGLHGVLLRLSPQGTPLDALRIPVDYHAVTCSMDIDPKGRLLFLGLAGHRFGGSPTKIQMGSFLHQHEGFGDIFFGITAPLGPALVTEPAGNQFKLNWSEYLSGFTLESSTSPAGPWTPVTTSTNSITLDAGTSGSQFFRLKETTE